MSSFLGGLAFLFMLLMIFVIVLKVIFGVAVGLDSVGQRVFARKVRLFGLLKMVLATLLLAAAAFHWTDAAFIYLFGSLLPLTRVWDDLEKLRRGLKVRFGFLQGIALPQP